MSPSGDELADLFAHPGRVEPAHAEFLREEIDRSPEPAILARFLVRYAERNGLPRGRQLLLALLTVAGQSPFLGELLLRHPAYLPWAFGELGRGETRSPEDLRQELARFRYTLSGLSDPAALRRFKLREYLRIALRDFLGSVDLPGVTRELSLLADTLLNEAYLLAWRELVNRCGPPQFVDDQGRIADATFAILSLGKLGGEELNYSSDIDLVYVYSREGQTAGGDGGAESVLTNREFFTRLAEGVTQRISGISPEGQVFRVDLGLRPGGKDGELVHSRRSFLSYHRTWARTWERQALIKARCSAGDLELGQGVLRDLQDTIYPASAAPFVALEIKEMKDRIDGELSRSGRSEVDVKLGRGGLRELEFAVQALQLSRGGRDPWLRDGNTLRALHRLADKELVSFGEHFALSRAYVFLRRVEHRLQLERNRQTYLLPPSLEGTRVLARRLGYTEPPGEADAFRRDLEEHRAVIRSFYDSVFGRVAQVSLDDPGRDPLLDLMPEAELRELLVGLGASRPDEMVPHLKRIRRLLSPERIRPDGRREMRRISAAILREAMASRNPDRAFCSLERFLSTLLLDRDAVRHLLQNAEWIPALIRLFGKSEYLSQILIRRPEILTELGRLSDGRRERPSPEALTGLRSRVGNAREIREAAAFLRRFYHLEVLQIGFRDIHRQDSLTRTLQSLTGLADACLSAAETAATELDRAGARDAVRFCVLGLGRLGYRELDYNSDLDLVFVAEPGPHGGGLETARRRAEILIHLLTAVTQEGSLYSVDLRLRPTGREGDLVQTGQGLIGYYRETARTWEKMAFLKARPVAGDLSLGWEVLGSILSHVFDRSDAARLSAEVREMKEQLEKAASQAAGADRIPVKLGSGGILDIHFLIEYLQILHRIEGPADRDTLRMLTHLYGKGLIPPDDYHRLYAGYLLLRSLDHAMRLLYDRPGDLIPTAPHVLDRLAGEVSLSVTPGRDASAETLLALLEETRRSIRGCFLKILG